MLPEGNAGFVVGCSFEQDVTDAASGQICFAFGQEGGGDADAAKFFRYVEGDDVGEGRIFFGENESSDVGVLHSDQAVGGAEREKVPQSGFRVGDAGREAGLVEFVERGEVLRVVGAEDRGHEQDSTPQEQFCGGRPPPPGATQMIIKTNGLREKQFVRP